MDPNNPPMQFCCLLNAYYMAGQDKDTLKTLLETYYQSPKGEKEFKNSRFASGTIYDLINFLLEELPT